MLTYVQGELTDIQKKNLLEEIEVENFLSELKKIWRRR